MNMSNLTTSFLQKGSSRINQATTPCLSFFSTSPSITTSQKPRIVILGTGWGGFTLARRLNKTIYDVRLISPANHFLFTPLLPSTSVGTLEFRAIQEPVRTIPHLGEYYQAKAKGIDTQSKIVHCADIFEKSDLFQVKYDYLCIACGNKTNTFGIDTVSQREGKEVFFLKHLHHARQIRNRVMECFERACSDNITPFQRKRLLSFVVVGGGPTSCEFTSELHDFVVGDVKRWYPDLIEDVKISLVEAGSGLLGGFDRSLSEYYLKRLVVEKRVDVRTNTAVVGIEDRYGDDDDDQQEKGKKVHWTMAHLADGTTIPFGTMIWSAGLASVKFVQSTSDQFELQDRTGRIYVDEYLRVPDQDGRIFAIGDCATLKEASLPPTASVAEQQGTYLADCFNLYYSEYSDVVLSDRIEDEDTKTSSTTTSENKEENQQTKPRKRQELPLPGPVAPALMPWNTIEFLNRIVCTPRPHFQYKNRGSMAGMGFGGGVTDLTNTDLPMPKGTMSGLMAFITWRTTYLTKQLSWANMMLIPMYWFKAMVFGRDISRF